MPADAAYLPIIEQLAGELFRTVEAFAWIADSDNVTDPQYRTMIEGGCCWVAVADDGKFVGFLCAEAVDAELHIDELAVILECQRQGVGRRLLETAIAWAIDRGLRAVTLTTFRSLPWNEPFYARAGFDTLPDGSLDARLAALLAFEAERGLARETRCAMRRYLGNSQQ